jgi:hypothetical protein
MYEYKKNKKVQTAIVWMLTYVCVFSDGAEACADNWIGYESVYSCGRQEDDGLD